MNIIERIFSKTINRAVERRAKFMLTDADGFYEQHQGIDQRDRYNYDREAVLREVLDAWRMSPIARRLVQLTTQYVVGGGITASSKHKRTNAFLQEFWNHPLNQLPARVFEWCDELIRSGELFIAISTNAAGMSFVRAIPAIHIGEVVTAENDVQQELSYYEKDPELGTVSGASDVDGRVWPAYDSEADSADEAGTWPAVMLHFAINRPVGAVRGESDLAPMLKWITRYTAWLEDRVRLNRFRQVFLYVVKGTFSSEAERQARQMVLSQNPPTPGSILVTDNSEEWDVLQPELDSFEAREDGLAIKKMIATGAAVPLHFLAEPEGTNKTTAESAGGPTFRHFEQRQEFFIWMVKQVCAAVVRRRSMTDRMVKADAAIEVRGTDLSARDNIAMAQASAEVITAFTGLYEKGLIDGAELVRLAYRFAGESVDIQDLLARGEKDIQDRPAAEEITKPETGKAKEKTDSAPAGKEGKEEKLSEELLEALRKWENPVLNMPAPVVNISNTPPAVTIEPAQVTVNVPEQPAPVVNMESAQVTVNVPEQAAPQVTVNLPEQAAPVVNITNPEPRITNQIELPQAGKETIRIQRDARGNVTSMTKE